MKSNVDRFSGHESFVCRYGWLPKVYRAVKADRYLLRSEENAMNALGIGRNMVKSLQFWAEATAVLRPAEEGGHEPGPVGMKLFGKGAWDPYLESLESLWLIHWQLCTEGGLAAWKEVFGEGKLIRFERKQLAAALGKRGEGSSRPLASSTLDQHSSIFIQSYQQEDRGTDDTSWSPLQDLGLLRAVKGEDGRTIFNSEPRAPMGLSLRVFAMALIEFMEADGDGERSVEFSRLLNDPYSPGTVFRLDEQQLRFYVESMCASLLDGALRFVDTADTQSLVLNRKKIDPQYRLRQPKEVSAHV